MDGASFAYSGAAGTRGTHLIRSYRKERKSILGCFSGQTSSNHSSVP